MAPVQVSDPQAFGQVGLLLGGDSAEREISLKGGADVSASLHRSGVAHDVYDGAPALFAAIGEGAVDRVFNLMHGPGGEDGAIQGALALMNVPLTGSGLLGSALSMDKVRSKWVWERLGVPTAPFVVIEARDGGVEDRCQSLALPLFVKPTGLGSSLGVSRVTDREQLAAAVEEARRFSETVIIEQGIEGKEYFVGILRDSTLPLIGIETPNEFYDYEAKYLSDRTRYHCPSGLPEGLELALGRQALEAFHALHCSGWGRVDFILDEAEKPWFLEVNTAPGMTDHSLLPQAAAEQGVDFDELVWRILETSL